MATCKQPPQEFIKNAFTPQIAVICSSAAEESCQKNNLSFTELLQPFCKLGTEVHFKEPSGSPVSIKNLKISLVDINTRPPQPTLARKFLNSSVSEAPDPRPQKLEIQDYTLEIPPSTPWFESWRDTFLQVQFPSDHEFTKHYLACMLVVSSTDKDPIQTMMHLMQCVNEMQNVGPTKLPKWFNKSTLYYYVILHENLSGDHVFAVESFDSLKNTYGAGNCFLLRMNSRPSGKLEEQLPDPWCQFINTRIQLLEGKTPDSSPSTIRAFPQIQDINSPPTETGNTLDYHPLSPEHNSDEDLSEKDHIQKSKPTLHGICLTTEDVEQVKLLLHEFCTKALLPYVEKQIHLLSDFAANKKGVSRSLFSATKRWFTPNKPGSSVASNTLLYSSDSPELQIRRLGDLYFMFGLYHLAFEAYHAAKRDFIVDQAWLYYAGALEMAALSAYMDGDYNRKTCDYMEESISTYLGSCKVAQFATRATLLSSECLKKQGFYGEAANQLIRMTSEESDLRSALLLEQAAYCFLSCTKPTMVRKYAFHMVLAGNRFSKAFQRKHSLRCYKQAYQIFQKKGWNLAEDHIHYTIGRQANNLNLEEAVASYSRLLTGQSRQSPQQQALFLREYLIAYSTLLKKQNILVTQVLPLPSLKTKATKVLVGPTAPLRTPGKVPAVGININTNDDSATTLKWNKLEEMLVHEAQGSLPMIFKPLTALFTFDDVNSANPIAIIGEPIQVCVTLENTLQIMVNLTDIYLLWQYKDDNNRFAANEIMGNNLEHCMKTHDIKSILLQANSSQEIILSITPLAVGEVVLKGICYSLISSSNNDEQIIVKGKQVFNLKSQKKEKEKIENRFKINVVPPSPCLQVSFCEMNSELLRNELQQISVELRNVGIVPLHNIYMATSVPHLLSSCDFKTKCQDVVHIPDLETLASREKEARRNHVSHLPLSKGALEPGQYHNITIWLKAPDKIGPAYIDLLIYYENIHINSIPRYRLVRHMWHLQIQECIKVEVCAERSSTPLDFERLMLSVKASNLNKTHHAMATKITLINAALLSNHWVLMNEVVAPDKVTVQSQESVAILLKAQQTYSRISNYSQVFFDLVPTSVRSSDSAYLDFAKRNERHNINIFDDLENINKLHKKPSTAIIIRWQAVVTDSQGNKRIINGQNHIPIDITEKEFYAGSRRKRSTVTFETKYEYEMKNIARRDGIPLSLRKQVTYNIKHPATVAHDFTKSKLCIVHVQLMLQSHAEIPLVVIIKTVQDKSTSLVPARPTIYYPYPSKKFRWITTRSVQKTVPPSGMNLVELSLVVLALGTYDLGAHLEVWCLNADQPDTAILQICRNQSALVVTNVSS